MSRDPEAAKEFYREVLGWDYQPSGPDDDYTVAMAGGIPVAGINTTSRTMHFPVAWAAYFAVESADEAADRIRERGATVAVGPMKFGNGRVAWAADPAGATFGIWEGVSDPDWRVGRGAGAPVWLELRTRDAFAAAIFYGEVLGWDPEGPGRSEVRYEHDQVMVRIGGFTVAGLRGGALETAPNPHVRPRWHVYFAVPDVDLAAHHAEQSGGRVITAPNDSPFGREATICDREGGLFTVSTGGP
ncbi:VOC family protein [Streptomyces sp. TP-A0874]|uniref:VOC family protein n=1 Tax=Streptomyces sp. TP-A0874 TaxID=549819 RepID=UPI001FCE083E|nr:VOC family protein [Streptomyces sp. TP-A0874]